MRAGEPQTTAPPRRPSMISARYRQREERRRLLKISASKLRKIEDPEASLCRSVLINNTLRQLQREPPEPARRRTPSAPALDADECDVLLAHLYVPPAPRMLTTIDEDDGDEPVAKRARTEEPPAALSCGRASLLAEPVFRPLVASLET